MKGNHGVRYCRYGVYGMSRYDPLPKDGRKERLCSIDTNGLKVEDKSIKRMQK